MQSVASRGNVVLQRCRPKKFEFSAASAQYYSCADSQGSVPALSRVRRQGFHMAGSPDSGTSVPIRTEIRSLLHSLVNPYPFLIVNLGGANSPPKFSANSPPKVRRRRIGNRLLGYGITGRNAPNFRRFSRLVLLSPFPLTVMLLKHFPLMLSQKYGLLLRGSGTPPICIPHDIYLPFVSRCFFKVSGSGVLWV